MENTFNSISLEDLMENTLKSISLCEIAKTYVVDGKCLKSRNRRKELVNEQMIEKMIQIHDNIVIQEGEEIKIYCDDEFFKRFNQVMEHEKQFNHSNSLFMAYQKGQIEVFVKYSKKKSNKEKIKHIKANLDKKVFIELIEMLELLKLYDSF